MKRNPTKRRALVSLALVFSMGASVALTGCEALGLDGGEASTPADAKKKPAKKAKVVVKKDVVKDVEEDVDYERPVYPDNARRNPFQPEKEIIIPTVIDDGSDGSRPLEPLEQFAINRLKLVAIISSVVVPKAMFVDPKGTGHVVKERDRIGRKGAIIIDIRENEVDIQESGGDEDGASRLRTLKLSTDDLKVSDEGGLSDEEREALERLIDTDEGRKQLRERLGEGSKGSSTPSEPTRGIAPPPQ